MSRPRRHALLLFAVAAALACSQSDTLLVINVASAPDVTNVSRINVRADRSNGSPFTTSFDVAPLDAGPVAPFFQRVTLDGWEGHVRVTGEALAADVATVASAVAEIDMKSGEAVVAFLTFRLPDAGTGATAADGGDAAAPDPIDAAIDVDATIGLDAGLD